ncbi:carboxylesterase family protein [Sediminicola luteus]|uniref:Uncharacterized protein n=1 Tax=Sediminicola luteus TaxID=319238 RepID=A0A2A4G6D5_9FLAO|nr:alpha/beta hydrolase-fold protein [Sediminicola luteus]PCE63546.1 hypothetical protein B7P33_15210 [Sediminicola luteus]
MKSIHVVCLLLGAITFGFGQSGFERKMFVQDQDSLPYRLLLPADYNENQTYPVLFFLHGAGERGADNEKQLTHGKSFLEEANTVFGAIVVAPQCPADSYWSNVAVDRTASGNIFHFKDGGTPTHAMKLLMGLLDNVLTTYSVKSEAVYVGGLSMGGMGTFELVSRRPGVFAAAFPVCGGAHPDLAAGIAETNWWLFHGDADRVVDVSYSKTMLDALTEAKAQVRFTLYENVGHDSWNPTFLEPALLPWLFSKR